MVTLYRRLSGSYAKKMLYLGVSQVEESATSVLSFLSVLFEFFEFVEFGRVRFHQQLSSNGSVSETWGFLEFSFVSPRGVPTLYCSLRFLRGQCLAAELAPPPRGLPRPCQQRGLERYAAGAAPWTTAEEPRGSLARPGEVKLRPRACDARKVPRQEGVESGDALVWRNWRIVHVCLWLNMVYPLLVCTVPYAKASM